MARDADNPQRTEGTAANFRADGKADVPPRAPAARPASDESFNRDAQGQRLNQSNDAGNNLPESLRALDPRRHLPKHLR